MMENDDNSRIARIAYMWLPAAVSVVAFAASLLLSSHYPDKHLPTRSGSIIALCGAVSSYGGASRIWIRKGDLIRGVREVPYGIVGLVLGVVGALLWGYGDI
jgi:hypothetical protein